MDKLSKDTLFPSAKALLEAGISCRQPGGKGWAIYWMEGGAELTLFPGGEGPQEFANSDIDGIIEAIGGDQPAVLTPASLRRFRTVGEVNSFRSYAQSEAIFEAGVNAKMAIVDVKKAMAYMNRETVEFTKAEHALTTLEEATILLRESEHAIVEARHE